MSATGRVREIHICAERAAPMTSVEHADAIAGKGLSGDRYASGMGSYSRSKGVRDVTLIETEALWDLYHTTGIDLHPSLTRRNLVTEGVKLSELVGQRFTIGGVSLLGLRPCPPCQHLTRLAGIPEILRGLARSGGIYAQILSGGRLMIDDVIRHLPGVLDDLGPSS